MPTETKPKWVAKPRYFAVRIRCLRGRKWCLYATSGIDNAIRKADNRVDCIEVTKVVDLEKEEYDFLRARFGNVAFENIHSVPAVA